MSRRLTFLFGLAAGAASAAALLLCALAPSIGVLLLALGMLGVTTMSGQVLTPLAGDLAGDAHGRSQTSPDRVTPVVDQEATGRPAATVFLSRGALHRAGHRQLGPGRRQDR